MDMPVITSKSGANILVKLKIRSIRSYCNRYSGGYEESVRRACWQYLEEHPMFNHILMASDFWDCGNISPLVKRIMFLN